MAKELGDIVGLNLHLETSATMCLINPRGLGKVKHVEMPNLWRQESSQSGWFITKKAGTNVNPGV